MSYTALYRKFRPSTFNEIVGQEHITKTLKNQIIANRIGHAYLFNGGRGTGKTSAAKILARAINCLNPQEGEPCNECEICKAALSGSLTDIVEMDAASNNSVEDVRSIREEVNFLPTVAKYRVYIIDEVHMLSTGAFNALLKTLEEPPEHVKFILATTEPQKLPTTILSRCQRFDFKKISETDISKRLAYVCEQSNIEITTEALKIISILSEGAMRDALSILERCMQEGEGKIDEDKIKELVGIPKLEMIYKIVKAIFEYDIENSIKAINEVIGEGKDPNNILWEMIKYIKDILVYKVSNKLQIYSEKEIKQIEELAKIATKERILQIIYDLSELENKMKWSSQRGILFQVEIIKLCNKVEIEKIENNIKSKSTNKDNENEINKSNIIMNNKMEVKKSNNVNENKKIDSNIGLKDGIKNWEKIIEEIKQSGKILLYTNLINSRAVEINDMTIGIEFPKGITPFGKTILEKPENINEIARLVSIAYGKEMRIKILDNVETQSTNKKQESNSIENIVNDLDIPINIIDE